MIELVMQKRVVIIISAVIVLASAGILASKLYQSCEKTDEIYASALEDFSKGDYQNAYYLFSKVSIFSNLKPVAIYHRAECARMLEDDKSELKQYQLLFNNYPNHKLSIRSRYLAGQKLIDSKPHLAKKYFEYIIHNAPDTDYAKLVVLGRLSDEIISGLGVFGDFSFNKLMIMLTGEENKYNILPIK